MLRLLGDIYVIIFCFKYVFAYCLCITDFRFLFVDEMASKSAMAEFHHRLLKRPHEDDGSDNLGLVSSEEPKFSLASGSSAPEVPLPKKQKGKKAAKVKEVIQLDFEVPPTSEAKS